MNKLMTKQEWFEYLEKTWDAAQKEAWAEQRETERDSDCKEADGCPTEKAVLQRFWREAQKQEPVAWLHPANPTCVTTDPTAYARGIPLVVAQPKREWQGLTEEEVFELTIPFGAFEYGDAQGHKRLAFANAIEAKLKEKNNA